MKKTNVTRRDTRKKKKDKKVKRRAVTKRRRRRKYGRVPEHCGGTPGLKKVKKRKETKPRKKRNVCSEKKRKLKFKSKLKKAMKN